MKILIPIVGRSEMQDTEYIRSLYEIKRKTVFQHLYESLVRVHDSEFVVVLRLKDVERFHFDDMIRILIPNVKIVIATGDTKGAACSCLLAIEFIEEDKPLIIASSDSFFLPNPQEVIENFQQHKYAGGITVFDNLHPKLSFVDLDEKGLVREVAEKRPISRNATTGFFYFAKGRYFIESAEKMIMKNAAVNGQYYVAPTYNEMILSQQKIGIFQIAKEEYFDFKDMRGIKEYEDYLTRREKNEV